MTGSTENELTSTKKTKLIDQIIEKYGYGWVAWKNYIIVFFIISLEGFHLNYFGNMLIPLQKYYDMSDEHIQIISSLTFLAVGIGSIATGYITEKFKRMTILYTVIFLLATGHLCIGFTNNILIFGIIRVVIGICVGISVPISLNLLTEYLPIKYRAVMLSGVWLGFTTGILYNLFLMWIIMPNLERYLFPNTMLISSGLSILVFIVVLVLIKDSPRNLLLNGDNKKAFEILEYLHGKPLTDEEKQELQNESKGSVNNEMKASIREIFNKDLRLTTCLLIFVWMLNSLATYGPMLISTKTLQQLNLEDDTKSNTDIIVSAIIIYLIYFPSSIVGGIASEIPKLGRNKTNMLSLVIAIVFNILTIWDSDRYQIYFGVYLFSTSITFSVSTAYSCEVYPTKVRDLALGFLFFCTRVGGFISQIIFIYFDQWYIWIPYYASLVFCSLNILCLFFLPIETFARPLDEEIGKDEKLLDNEKGTIE
jgi:MFS family permease